MDIFLEKALSQVPRILGFMDRDSDSRTLGCCDRTFWHYKTIDFANARFQEACLVLTLASLVPYPQSRFYDSSLLKKWALAAIEYWARERHFDGSVDESYPFERHFCATAFTLHAVSKSLLLLGEAFPGKIVNTGRFLIKYRNPEVANQVACAAASLYNLFLLTNEKEFYAGFDKKLGQLFAMQDSHGAFQEYGGSDLGYDSLTLSFLAEIYQKTRRKDVEDSARKCLRHWEPLIDEDGYFSSEEMSRHTQFLYPYGFFVFQSPVFQKIEKGLKKDAILNPCWMDDRYCIPLTGNYLMTAHEESH